MTHVGRPEYDGAKPCSILRVTEKSKSYRPTTYMHARQGNMSANPAYSEHPSHPRGSRGLPHLA